MFKEVYLIILNVCHFHYTPVARSANAWLEDRLGTVHLIFKGGAWNFGPGREFFQTKSEQDYFFCRPEELDYYFFS